MSEWTPIEEVVAELERNPKMAEHLRAARKRLAPILYPEGGPRYERMIRGLGPVERKPPYISIAKAWRADKAKIERMRTAFQGIASCSTCEMCREVARKYVQPTIMSQNDG